MQPREVGELFSDAHLGVEAAFLGHVAEAAPLLLAYRSPVPADLAAVGLGHAHDDAHRGGLARAVRADEAADPPGVHGERHTVERGHRPVLLAQPPHRQPAGSRLRGDGLGRVDELRCAHRHSPLSAAPTGPAPDTR